MNYGAWHLNLNQKINLLTVIAVSAHPVQPVQSGENNMMRLQIQVSVQVLEIYHWSLSSAVMARGQCPQVECYLVLKHKQPRRYDCHDNINIDAAEWRPSVVWRTGTRSPTTPRPRPRRGSMDTGSSVNTGTGSFILLTCRLSQRGTEIWGQVCGGKFDRVIETLCKTGINP